MSKKTSSHAKRGPRAIGQDPKAEIMVAALSVFAARGYQEATIKAIATKAAVDTKLVHYYFGTKAELFGTCMRDAFTKLGLFAKLQQALAATPGSSRTYIEAVLTTVETTEAGLAFLGLARGLGTHEESRELFHNFVTHQLIGTANPDQGLNLSLAGSQLFGLVFLRYVVKIPPLAELSITDAARLIAPTLDRYLSQAH